MLSPVCGSSEMDKPLSCRKKQPARERLHVAEGSAVGGMFMRVGGWVFLFLFYCFWMVKDKAEVDASAHLDRLEIRSPAHAQQGHALKRGWRFGLFMGFIAERVNKI